MDCTGLTATQLTAAANAFMQIDALMEDDLPESFPDMLAEYLALPQPERAALQSEMSARANFRAYADTLGVGGMADALMAVASDMARLDSRALSQVAQGGAARLAAAVAKLDAKAAMLGSEL